MRNPPNYYELQSAARSLRMRIRLARDAATRAQLEAKLATTLSLVAAAKPVEQYGWQIEFDEGPGLGWTYGGTHHADDEAAARKVAQGEGKPFRMKRVRLNPPREIDPASIQEIRNSIREAQLTLRTGRFNGRRLSTPELLTIRRQIERDLARIGESWLAGKQTQGGVVIRDVTPAGYGPNPVRTRQDLLGRSEAYLTGPSGKGSQHQLFGGEHGLTPEERQRQQELELWRAKRAKEKAEGQMSLFAENPASYDRLPLNAAIVAEVVAGRPYTGGEWSAQMRDTRAAERTEALRQQMTDADVRAFSDHVDAQVRAAYAKRQPWIMKIMRARGNAGRDTLYMFTSHWLSSWLQRRGKVRAAPTGSQMSLFAKNPQYDIRAGSHMVRITSQGYGRKAVSARLYVGNGETATQLAWKGNTLAGARRWAAKILAHRTPEGKSYPSILHETQVRETPGTQKSLFNPRGRWSWSLSAQAGRARAARALDLTHRVGERGPKTMNVRDRVARALDAGRVPHVGDVRWLESLVKSNPRYMRLSKQRVRQLARVAKHLSPAMRRALLKGNPRCGPCALARRKRKGKSAFRRARWRKTKCLRICRRRNRHGQFVKGRRQ